MNTKPPIQINLPDSVHNTVKLFSRYGACVQLLALLMLLAAKVLVRWGTVAGVVAVWTKHLGWW